LLGRIEPILGGALPIWGRPATSLNSLAGRWPKLGFETKVLLTRWGAKDCGEYRQAAEVAKIKIMEPQETLDHGPVQASFHWALHHWWRSGRRFEHPKTQAYCDLTKLYAQVEAAQQENDTKTVESLVNQTDALIDKLGPEYSKMIEGLEEVDLTSSEGKELMSILSALDKLCTR
jgi:hypothetical protein